MLLIIYMFFKLILIENVMASETKSNSTSALYYSEWVCVKNEKGISLHERWVKVNDSLKVRERKGEFYVVAELDEVVSFLRSHETIKLWMKGVDKVELLEVGRNDVVYLNMGLPWPFSDRDLVAQYSYKQIDEVTRWVEVKSVHGLKEMEKNKVRINDYRASWLITRTKNNTIKIVFTVFCSEPPMFPQWVQEPVLKKIFFGNLMRLKQRLNR